jgi:hypothetical protein
MGVAADTHVDIIELPNQAPGFFGVIGKLLGVHERAEVPLVVLPVVRDLLRGIPASLLVAPDQAQARLPYDLRFDD